jgi:hypothetical protein
MLSLFNYIDPFYFVVALAVGLLFTYLTAPKPTVIIRYPTPENAGKITYRDDADVCYKYKVVPTDCPADRNLIKEVPIQI